MAYDFIRSGDGSFVSIKADGKAVQKSLVNALNKARTTSYFHEFPEDGEYEGSNPFSGVKVALTALEASIYEWVMGWNRRYEMSGDPKVCEAPVATFDGMRYLMLAINSKVYYDLID